ncbi:MAG: winged helix-turn-helix domain-containing protein [Candidatus Heimdallarchaeota archaeon]
MTESIRKENINHLEMKDKLPPSAREIYKILVDEGPMTTKEVLSRVNYASRTVRYALKKLISLGLVRKVPYLLDMRQSKYLAHKRE